MTELAMAMYAASRDAHSTDRDRTTRNFAGFVAAFDEQAERRRLAGPRASGGSAGPTRASLRD